MIVVDVNLLLYASFASFSQHTAARRWLEARLNGAEQLLLPGVSVFGFVRIASNPRIFEQPLSVSPKASRQASMVIRFSMVPSLRTAR